MSIKVTVHRSFKITINGVDYESVDQLPPEMRAIYEQAMHAPKGLTVNGRPATMDELPPDVRDIVSNALGSGARERSVPGWASTVLFIVLVSVAYFWWTGAR